MYTVVSAPDAMRPFEPFGKPNMLHTPMVVSLPMKSLYAPPGISNPSPYGSTRERQGGVRRTYTNGNEAYHNQSDVLAPGLRTVDDSCDAVKPPPVSPLRTRENPCTKRR
jgi:hypothetical protein